MSTRPPSRPPLLIAPAHRRRRNVYIAFAAITFAALASFVTVLVASTTMPPRAEDVLPPGAPGHPSSVEVRPTPPR